MHYKLPDSRGLSPNLAINPVVYQCKGIREGGRKTRELEGDKELVESLLKIFVPLAQLYPVRSWGEE